MDKKNKGFLQDPLVYLVSISIILMGLTTSGVFPSFASTKTSPSPLPELNKEIASAGSLAYLESPKNFQGDGIGGALPQESADYSMIQESSLVAFDMPISPLLWFDGNKEIGEYTVKDGDTIQGIANNFGISKETILWANNLGSGSSIKTGQTLVILPVSGVLYRVETGDTLGSIAKKYKGQVNRILAFNDLANENDIIVGDILVIPDGIMPVIAKPAAPKIPLASNYFILPVQGRITQGLHFYNAVDFAAPCGSPIYATAQGQVIREVITSSTSRYANNGGGSYIRILHPNGTTTYYGHLSAYFVNLGDSVSQGQIIALVGGKPGTPGAGNSTGCHVHFEVGGARNPFAY